MMSLKEPKVTKSHELADLSFVARKSVRGVIASIMLTLTCLCDGDPLNPTFI